MGSSINFDPVRNISPPGLGGPNTPLQRQPVGPSGAADIVAFGSQGVSTDQSMKIVIERAMEQLRAVVGEARAELGIPEGAALDTSAEATAGRILEFALGAFDRFRANHGELGEDDARQRFSEFIGAAIDRGISEARDILTSLSALNPEVDSNINSISGIIQDRLDAFAAGG